MSILTRRIKRTQIRRSAAVAFYALYKALYCRLWLASAIIVGFQSTCIAVTFFWQYKWFLDISWELSLVIEASKRVFFQKFRSVAEVAIIHK
jgi:hypothetical protein